MFSIEQLIGEYRPNTHFETTVSSAVLLILIADQGIIQDVLLLQRPMHLSSYAGDICFPGGIKEASDHCLKGTALRETVEEIGLQLGEQSIIGQLDDFFDKKNRLVRPYVAVIERSQLSMMTISEAEVEKVVFISLADIQCSQLDIANLEPSSRKPRYLFEYENFIIWGLTASILVHLSNILYGTDKPIGQSVQAL